MFIENDSTKIIQAPEGRYISLQPTVGNRLIKKTCLLVYIPHLSTEGRGMQTGLQFLISAFVAYLCSMQRTKHDEKKHDTN